MGDALEQISITDPATKEHLLAIARSMPDNKAEALLEISDATPYGGRTRWLRIGMGAGLGLVVGIVLLRAMRKR